MFQITHDKQVVYSLIAVRHNHVPLSDKLKEQLTWIWANETAIPYIEHLSWFKTDHMTWYLKEQGNVNDT